VELLKRCLFLEAHQRFDAWMAAQRGGADRDTEPHTIGRLALGSEGTQDELNEAWQSDDLDAFEDALSGYMRAGARAFLDAVPNRIASAPPPLPDPRLQENGIA